MDNFLMAAKTVVPMAIMLCIGILVRKAGIVDKATMIKFDKLNFKILLPLLLFRNIYDAKLDETFTAYNITVVLIIITVCVIIGLTVPRFYEHDKKRLASITQSIIRSNYVIFGISVATKIYGEGNVGIVAGMAAIITPLTNAISAIILEYYCSKSKDPLKKIASALKNPLVIGALVAIAVRLLKIKLPSLIYSPIKDIGSCATPMCFISLGVSLNFAGFKKNAKSLAITNSIRMFIIPAVLIPLAVLCGVKGQILCTVMIFLACPCAVSSYPMAVAMGADGEYSGQMVFISTVLSLFTIFVSVFVLSSLNLL